MNRPLVPVLAVALALAAVAVTSCGKKQPAPAAAPVKPAAPAAPTVKPKVDPPPAPLSVTQKMEIEADFAEARTLANEAMEHRRAGDALLRDKGAEAANDEYVKAKKGFQAAIRKTERWAEPELGVVSQKQVDKLPELVAYVTERGKWVAEISNLGKLHQR